MRVAQQLIAGSTGNDLYGFHLMGAVRHGFQNKENHLDETEISEWGFIQIELDKEKEIDARRKEIGLSSLSDSRKKAIFSKKNNASFLISNGSNFRTYLWAKKEDYLQAKKKLLFIP